MRTVYTARVAGEQGSRAASSVIIDGRYEVHSELGEGGMGQVLLVSHRELGKRFALKLIRPDRWDAELERRFRREARALARVDSRRVVQVTDFGVDPVRGPYYVMELVQGETLAGLLERKGPLGFIEATRYALELARALSDVHAAGLVHRDIKPANVGVLPNGGLRLLDFGLATSFDDAMSSQITENKKIMGSLPYMSPEQFSGDAPAVIMDVWALGIVYCQMLSGKLPFQGTSTPSLLRSILFDDPWAELSLPAPALAVLHRLLCRDGLARVQSSEEAIELLEGALAGPALTTVAETRTVEVVTRVKRPRWHWLAITVAVGVFAVLLGAYFWASQPKNVQVVTPASVAPPVPSHPQEPVEEAVESPVEVSRPLLPAGADVTTDRTPIRRRPSRPRTMSVQAVETQAPAEVAPQPEPRRWNGDIIDLAD